MANKDLKRKAASGVVWTTIQRFSNLGIQFIAGIILARLLMPEDYGIIGMLTIFMQVSQVFMGGGFGSALIQKKNPTQEDYSTVFYWNLGMSLFLYLILFVSAPYIAEFYHIPLLSSVLRVQAIVLIISALTLVQANVMRKTFKFRQLSIISVLSSVISLTVTICMAYNGFGVWALVAQNILIHLLPSMAYFYYNKWYPSLVFSVKSFKELFSFGVYMFLTLIITDICNNIQGLLIGRLYNATTMGFYSKAYSTVKLASYSISQSLTKVSYPLYAELQNDRTALIAMIRKFTMVISYITFPLMFLLILLGKPIFVLLYSEKWLESVPYFQILCLSGLSTCLQAVNLQSVAAIGKSKVMFRWVLVKRSIGIAMIAIGLIYWGIWGLLWSFVFQGWITYLINAWLVSKHIGYKLNSQLKDLSSTTFLSVGCFVMTYIVGQNIGFGLYTNAIIEFFMFCGIYLFVSYFMKMESFFSCIQLASGFISKKRNKKS